MGIVAARDIAKPYLDEVRGEVAAQGLKIRLQGFLTTAARPSQVYSDYAARGCERVGIEYGARQVDPEALSREIFTANQDPDVHGVIVYYPVFGGIRDRSLQNEVAPEKDVEGLHASWATRLYNDVRYVDAGNTKKAILPCTPLGIVKALNAMGATDRSAGPHRSAAGRTITIFNRSEVVGRPLAAMLAHDGALVYSFDVDGLVVYEGKETRESTEVDRAQALSTSDIVITGVPDRSFDLVRAAEIKPGATCINFSHVKNLADDVPERAGAILRRVGPITVAMLLRNTLRLYRNFHV